MISLTKFDGSTVWLNPDLIQSIDAHADTRVTLSTGVVFMVQEPPVAIAAQIMEYRRAVYAERTSPGAAFQLIQRESD